LRSGKGDHNKREVGSSRGGKKRIWGERYERGTVRGGENREERRAKRHRGIWDAKERGFAVKGIIGREGSPKEKGAVQGH